MDRQQPKTTFGLSPRLRLIDWKRTKDLPAKFASGYQSLKAPLQHLPDAAGIKYRLQLNVYRWILEKYYNKAVASMFIVCLHPEHESPWVDEVPVMEAEVEAVMAARRSVLDVTDAKGDVCGGCFAVAESKTQGQSETCPMDTSDVYGGAAVASLSGRMPLDIAMLINAFAEERRAEWVAKAVLANHCRKIITAFLGPDDTGFWLCPGPEQLRCLCHSGRHEVPVMDVEVVPVLDDVLGGGAFDEDGAMVSE